MEPANAVILSAMRSCTSDVRFSICCTTAGWCSIMTRSSPRASRQRVLLGARLLGRLRLRGCGLLAEEEVLEEGNRFGAGPIALQLARELHPARRPGAGLNDSRETSAAAQHVGEPADRRLIDPGRNVDRAKARPERETPWRSPRHARRCRSACPTASI